MQAVFWLDLLGVVQQDGGGRRQRTSYPDISEISGRLLLCVVINRFALSWFYFVFIKAVYVSLVF